MIKPSLSQCSQTGLTLIELLISMLIGLVLLAGVLMVFSSSQQFNTFQNNMSQLQEAGRFALDIMGKDLRNADAWECRGNPDPGNDPYTGLAFALEPAVNYLGGIYGSGSGNDAIIAADNIGVNNSDIITVAWRTGIWNNGVNPNCSATCPPVGFGCTTDSSPTLVNYQIMQLPDGSYALGRQYLAPDKPYVPTYTAAVIHHSNPAPPANQTQAVAPLLTNLQPIIDGVENMQILYGEDLTNSGSAMYYVPSSLLFWPDLSKVVSIKVSLLLATHDQIANRNALPSYTYNNQVYQQTDYKIRKVFNATICLRSRASC